MPDVAADPVGALVAAMLADSDVAAMVTTRGFGGELPPGETAAMPRAAFVIRASGGVPLLGGSYVEAEAQRVDVYAYGKTQRQASQLADLLGLKLRRIQRKIVSGTLIHWVNSAGGYSSGRDPETDWPRAWRSFQVFFALVQVS
jgi:hypothetical protein